MPGLAAILAVSRRTWRKTLRRPVHLSFSFVQPIVWMCCFGFLFQRYRIERLASDGGYLTFLVPGISAMSVLFGASQSGVELIRDLQSGFLQRLLLTPAGPHVLLAGKLLADVARLLVQAAALVALGLLLGARPAPSLPGLALALLGLALFAVFLASVSCAIAMLTKTPEGMATFVHLVNMPLLFTSTALVPERHMPSALAAVSAANPLSVTVSGFRAALVYGELPAAAPLVALAVLAALAFWLAGKALRRVATSPG